MNLNFFGGVNEIGGNMILLESQNVKVFLDFGVSYKRADNFFEFPLLQPTNLSDLLKTKLIPELDGLYRYNSFKSNYNDDGPISVTDHLEERKYDAVLLSHAHMDHYGYIGLIREDIPIYSSKITNKIVQLYERAGRTDFSVNSEHIDFRNIDYNTEERIGDLIVRRYNVDHSAYGASAFSIQAEKNVVYTGDFRLHGNNKAMSEDFLRLVQKEKTDYLLCEGTRLGLFKNENEKSTEEKILNSEEEVKKKCVEIVDSEENIIIYDGSQADLERIKILWYVAKKTGRTLILDSKKAFLLLNINENENLIDGLPQIGDFKILLGRSKLASNTKLCKELTEDCPDFYLESFKVSRKNHEKELIETDSIPVDQFIWGPELRKKVFDNSNEYIIYTSNGPLLLLHCKLNNIPISGTYIYGKSEPFTEEMEFTFTRLENWLKLCNLKLEYAHTSGHCFP
ncbi:MAG TPA: MBL fold metallo-hydrolase, partial [Candidatus Lokiarchaeia archaeon]